MNIDKREISMIPIDDLIPYERNPRQHPESQIEELKNSIRQWGWTMPVLVDENQTVLAGHGRLFAAKELGISDIPCIKASGWSEEQKKAYVIADNQIANNSNWDTSLLIKELRLVNESGFDMSQFGFDASYFDSYEPVYNPDFDRSSIQDSDIGKAQGKIDTQINGLQQEKADLAVEVMCPHCGGEFSVTGY